jgi:hypothetical protein
MSNLIATAALIVSMAGLILVLVQTRRVTEQTRIGQASAELSFNLGLNVRMQEVLLTIARDPESYRHVWGAAHSPESADGLPQREVSVQALIDLLSLALAGVELLPDLSVIARVGHRTRCT